MFTDGGEAVNHLHGKSECHELVDGELYDARGGSDTLAGATRESIPADAASLAGAR